MAGVNKVILLGNLGRDPELSYTQGGMAVCKFSIATSKKRKDNEEITSWHRCTAFGRTGEVIAQYIGKGQQLYVEGELSYGQYEKDGVVRYTTDIIVNEFSFIGGAKGNQQQGYNPQPQQNYQNQQNYNESKPHQQKSSVQQPPQQGFHQDSQPYPDEAFGQGPVNDDIPF